MKYPKAGDLQRATAMQVTSNPSDNLGMLRAKHLAARLRELGYEAEAFRQYDQWNTVGVERSQAHGWRHNVVFLDNGELQANAGGGRGNPWRHGPAHDAVEEAAQWQPVTIVRVNPYEVRSASGLEGVFGNQDDAEFHAAELRREGVGGVVVEKRTRGKISDSSLAARRSLREEEPFVESNPSSSQWQVSRSVTNMKQNIELLGSAFAATDYFRNIGVEVDDATLGGHGWLERCYGGTGYEPTCLVELDVASGRVESFPARKVWPVSGRHPERPPRGSRSPELLRQASWGSSGGSWENPARVPSTSRPRKGDLWSGSEIQSLLFHIDEWTAAQAKKWAKKHGYKYGSVDTTSLYHRLRQFDPGRRPCRTMDLPGTDPLVRAVVCSTKGR